MPARLVGSNVVGGPMIRSCGINKETMGGVCYVDSGTLGQLLKLGETGTRQDEDTVEMRPGDAPPGGVKLP